MTSILVSFPEPLALPSVTEIHSSLIFLKDAKGSFEYVLVAHLNLMNDLNSRHFASREVGH